MPELTTWKDVCHAAYWKISGIVFVADSVSRRFREVPDGTLAYRQQLQPGVKYLSKTASTCDMRLNRRSLPPSSGAPMNFQLFPNSSSLMRLEGFENRGMWECRRHRNLAGGASDCYKGGWAMTNDEIRMTNDQSWVDRVRWQVAPHAGIRNVHVCLKGAKRTKNVRELGARICP